MYLKLGLVGILLILLSFAVKAQEPDTNAIAGQASQMVDQIKPELGDYTVDFLKGLEGGIGYVFAALANFSGSLLGISKGSMLLIILGLAVIFGTLLGLKMMTSWGSRFFIVLVLFGLLLVVVGSIPVFFKYVLPFLQGILS